ncbi:XK-related protein [Novosphingobium sp. PY1]|nr:XK-related protein [Novosphingobium sp. PY1]
MADLPLSGKRWVWILAGLFIVIVLGVIVSSVRSSYVGSASGPPVAGAQMNGGNMYGPGVAPAHPPESEGANSARPNSE